MAPVWDDVAGELVQTGCASAADAENDPLVAVWVGDALLVWVLTRAEVMIAADVELSVDVAEVSFWEGRGDLILSYG